MPMKMEPTGNYPITQLPKKEHITFRTQRKLKNKIDVTCFIISLFNAQHVSDVNTYILRSLQLIC